MSTKRLLALFLVLTMCFALAAPAYADQNVSVGLAPESSCTVTFDANGGTLTGNASVTVAKGSVVSADQAPVAVMTGSEFIGWYGSVTFQGKELTYKFVLGEDTIEEDITLSAHYKTIFTEQQENEIKQKGVLAEGVLMQTNEEVAFGSTEPVAEVNGTNSFSFSEAFDKVKTEGGTVKLLADDTTTTFTMNSGDVTIDLNGHNMKTNGRPITVNGGTLTIISSDATVQDGTHNAVIDAREAGVGSVCATGTGIVNVNAGYYYAFNGNKAGMHAYNGGTIVFNGGYVSGADHNDNLPDPNNKGGKVFYSGVNYADNRDNETPGNIIVHGGTFDGRMSDSNWGHYEIDGGTFIMNVVQVYTNPTDAQGKPSGKTTNTNNPTDLNGSGWLKYGYEAVESGGAWVVQAKQPIASVNGVNKYSLREAVEAAQAGDTITLLADDQVSFANGAAAIVIDKNLTIDGNTFKVYGYNGHIDNVGRTDVNEENAHGFYITAGNVEIEDITLTGFGGTDYGNAFGFVPVLTAATYTGTLTMTDVTIDNYNARAVALLGGSLVMDHCTIIGDGVGVLNPTGRDHEHQAISIYGSGTSIISNTVMTNIRCDVNNAYPGWGDYWTDAGIVAFNSANVTINNCTVTSYTGEVLTGNVRYGTNAVENAGTGTVIINGGSYTSMKNNGNYALDNSAVLNSGSGAISITAGTFSTDPSDFVATGYKAVESGGVWVVQAKPVASIDGTMYMTLQAAFDVGGEVTLLEDVTYTDSLVISEGKNVVLNLNGKEINSTAGDAIVVDGKLTILDNGANGAINQNNANSDDTIWVKAGGELVIESGAINSTAQYGTVYCSGNLTMKGGTVTTTAAANAITLNGAATADISAGTVSGKWGIAVFGTSTLTVSGTAEILGNGDSAIATNGSESGDNFSNSATINISGGTIRSDDIAAYAPAATWNISGGTFTGTTAVYAKGGKLTITDGTFNGTGDAVAFAHGGSGATATGDAVVIESSNYPYSPVTVSITGGTFTAKGSNTKAVATYHTAEYAEATKFISGGTFNTEPAANYIVDGYGVKSEGSSYVVHKHIYGEPTWNGWKSTLDAKATFICSTCGNVIVEHATLIKTSGTEPGTIVITASAINPNGGVVTSSNEYYQMYHVVFGSDVKEYSYGEIAHYSNSEVANWEISTDGTNYITRAKNCTDFYFAVTADVSVRIAPATPNEAVTVNVEEATGGKNIMTYRVQWSLPANAQNVNAVIHRTRNDAKDITPNGILEKAGHKAWETKLNVRNGDYTYNVLNLSSNSVQAVILKITYTLNGHEYEYVTPEVTFVDIE